MQLKFEDGSRIQRDSRGEDPLIYFVPAAGWSGAVGFLALAEYEEHRATSIILQVYAAHEARLAALNPAELRLVMGRLAGALIQLFGHWKELRLEWPAVLIERLGADDVVALFRAAGCEHRQGTPLVFER